MFQRRLDWTDPRIPDAVLAAPKKKSGISGTLVNVTVCLCEQMRGTINSINSINSTNSINS